MAKHLSLILFISILCASCSRDIITSSHSAEDSEPVNVTLCIDAEQMQGVTRVTNETIIRDVNLYLFNAVNGTMVHVYCPATLCNFECPAGRYILYAAANLHRDLGKKTLAQVKAIKTPLRDAYNDLPMTGTAQVEITKPSNGATVQLAPVQVKRNVAKIAYNITVDTAVSDIRLISVQACSVPSELPLFEGKASAFLNNISEQIPTASAAKWSGVVYLPENLRGTVSSIAHERDKNAANAPANASYLMIRAMRGGSVLDYRVYLGENNTTDFNVRRNSRQTLDIVIKGLKQIDTRYNSYIVSVSDNFADLGLDKYCFPRDIIPWTVEIDINRTRNDGMRFTGKIQALAGSLNDFTINGQTGTSSDFFLQTDNNKIPFKYTPTVVTEAKSKLIYRVTVTDEYGYSQNIDVDRLCANNITVHRENGTITAAGALFTTDYGPLFRALCYEKGCTLTAKPAAGYAFSGWYADEYYIQPISTSSIYKYIPQTTYERIYAYFEKIKGNITVYTDPQFVTLTSDKGYSFDADLEAYIVPYGSSCSFTVNYRTPLFKGWYDKVGGTGNLLGTSRSYAFTATANCTIAPAYIPATNLSASATANTYIAPNRNAGYTFNARTQGNGRATTGITPVTLSGSTARVLWESGGTRGNVITEAEYNGGVICFRTGTSDGNALIGLFNKAGTCIWSWHIWAVNYNPSTTAQTYRGGRVFMDRNLGALTTSQSNSSARGLYYQWGRPAPFIYPQSTTTSTRAGVTYGTGYTYGQYDPVQGSAMTLTNSLAHPWIFMLGYYPNNDREEDYPDWINPKNPNLWGNASTSSFSDVDAKSIYDPCPPGWKVPDRKAFTETGLIRSSTTASQCYNMRYSTSTATAQIPMSGYFNGVSFVGNGSTAYLWSNTPAQLNSVCLSSSTALSVTSSAVIPEAMIQRDRALPVRCVKE